MLNSTAGYVTAAFLQDVPRVARGLLPVRRTDLRPRADRAVDAELFCFLAAVSPRLPQREDVEGDLAELHNRLIARDGQEGRLLGTKPSSRRRVERYHRAWQTPRPPRREDQVDRVEVRSCPCC